MNTYSRLDGETIEQFITRACEDKDGIGSWHEVAEVIADQCGVIHDESYYRKWWKGFSDGKRIHVSVSKKSDSGTDSENDNNAFEELAILKKQFQDQRREYNKVVAKDARQRHLFDIMKQSAMSLADSRKEFVKPYCEPECSDTGTEHEAALFLADWHYGMVTDNIWNTYNVDVCVKRVKKLLDKTIQYIKLHNVTTLHIAILGDMAHGGIHCSARVASEEYVCNQLMDVSELIAQFIEGLVPYVKCIELYSCYGNHMRTIQEKQDSLHEDNMEKIIPWWLQWRLGSYGSVRIHMTKFKEFVVMPVANYHVCCVHGDLDNIKNIGTMANTIFTKEFGFQIDYTVSADKHHLEEFETLGIENVIIRSLCGSDDYANDKRLYSSAGQTLMIFNKEDGRECTYNIKLR